MCLNELIKQSFVYGDKKNYLVAIIVSENDINREKIKLVMHTKTCFFCTLVWKDFV